MTSIEKKENKKEDSFKLLERIVKSIYNKVGKNIFIVDIRKVSTLCDYCIVAEGNVDRHLRAIALEIKKDLADVGIKPSIVEGLNDGNWVILDYLNIMVHLLLPEYREKYHLERLWQEGTIIDLKLNELSSECPSQ